MVDLSGDKQAPLFLVQVPGDIEGGLAVIDHVKLVIWREVQGFAGGDRKHAPEHAADGVTPTGQARSDTQSA